MSVPTKKALAVFWKGRAHEVPGVMIYGLWPSRISSKPPPPMPAWPNGSAVEEYVLHGEGWEIILWTIKLSTWFDQDDFERALRETFSAMVAHGAIVSWAGLEGDFVEPPSIFDSDEMGEGVYAFMTDDGAFVCSAQLHEQFRPVSEDELLQLRRVSQRAIPH
jgi:hypothetical protein